MRAVRVGRFGGPDVLVVGEEPAPVPGPGAVLVAVEVAGMTFIETEIRRGGGPRHARPELPYIPGGIVGGRVVAVARQVDPDWSGKRIVARTGRTGGFAEFATAPVDALQVVPAELDLADAVALCSDGSTAQGLIEGVRLSAGNWVLVGAAAGGVGNLLVQLAAAAGARVVGAARGAEKLEMLRGLGAASVIDYTLAGWAAGVIDVTSGAGADVVFDGVGGEIGRAAFEATARGGRFSVHGASSGHATVIAPREAADRGIAVVGIDQLASFGPHQKRWATEIMAKAVEGQIRPIIGQRFPLERAAEAHAAIEARATLGKTLIIM